MNKMKDGVSIDRNDFGRKNVDIDDGNVKGNAIDEINLDRSEKSLVETSSKNFVFDNQTPLVSKFSTSPKIDVLSCARRNKKVKSPTLSIKRKLCHNLDQKSPKLRIKKLPKLKLKGKIGSPGIKPKNVNTIKNYFESKSEAKSTSKADVEVKLEVENIDATKKVKVMDKVDAFERLMLSSSRGDKISKKSFKRTRGTPSKK